MAVYGMTGGIACGKSLACTILQANGWKIIDTDRVAHELLEPGATNYKKVVDAFGNAVVNDDGTIDRRSLGKIVFADASLREKLNALTHPAIREVWQSKLQQSQANFPDRPHVVAIPLLFECQLETLLPRIICIGCSDAVQWTRLMDRGWSPDHATQRLASQLSVQRKMELSDYVMWNEGSKAALNGQLMRLPW